MNVSFCLKFWNTTEILFKKFNSIIYFLKMSWTFKWHLISLLAISKDQFGPWCWKKIWFWIPGISVSHMFVWCLMILFHLLFLWLACCNSHWPVIFLFKWLKICCLRCHQLLRHKSQVSLFLKQMEALDYGLVTTVGELGFIYYEMLEEGKEAADKAIDNELIGRLDDCLKSAVGGT